MICLSVMCILGCEFMDNFSKSPTKPQLSNRNILRKCENQKCSISLEPSQLMVDHKNSKVSFKTLRLTFITIASILAGDQYDLSRNTRKPIPHRSIITTNPLRYS